MVYAQFSKQRSMCRQVVYLVGPEVLGVSDGWDAYGGQQVGGAQAVLWQAGVVQQLIDCVPPADAQAPSAAGLTTCNRACYVSQGGQHESSQLGRAVPL